MRAQSFTSQIAEEYKRTGRLDSSAELASLIDRMNSARAILNALDNARADHTLRQGIWSFLRGSNADLRKAAARYVEIAGDRQDTYGLQLREVARVIESTLPYFPEGERS